MAAALPITLDVAELAQDQVDALTASNILGASQSQYWAREAQAVQKKFEDTVRHGVTRGESAQQMAARIVGGTVAGEKVTGFLDTSRRRATTLVRTSVMTVANQARLESFKKNSDVVKGMQQISTLDDRTSDICVAYSGATWDLDEKPIGDNHLSFDGGCPRHFNCRSTIVPLLMSWEELGLGDEQLAELEPDVRASMDGEVPGDITMDAWLTSKGDTFQDELLGTARAQMWRDGEITLQDLVTPLGTPRTVEQLSVVAAPPPPKPVVAEPSGMVSSEFSPVDVPVAASRTMTAAWQGWYDKLPLDQNNAYRHYISGGDLGFADINAYLRGTKSIDDFSWAGDARAVEQFKTTLGTLDTMQRPIGQIMRELGALGEEPVVWRGVTSAKGTGLLKVGDEIIEEGYLSTSLNSYEAATFATQRATGTHAVYRIQLDDDMTAMYGNSIQHELVLPRGLKLRVTAVGDEFQFSGEYGLRKIRVIDVEVVKEDAHV
jgi:SPP1 gp7 family putative phage head morphogenesis protein